MTTCTTKQPGTAPERRFSPLAAFSAKYVSVIVSMPGNVQGYSARFDERHEFAAERYIHYRHALGDYTGTSRVEGGIVDNFEHGTIFIGE